MWQREWQLHDIGENLITKRLVIFRITRFLKCVLLPHARKKYYFFFENVSISKNFISCLNTRQLTSYGNLMVIRVIYYRQKFLDLINKLISNLDNQILDHVRS